MTDYTDLIAELRSGEIGYELAAADALEAQARRIAELEEQYANANAANLTFGEQAARIADLEAAVDGVVSACANITMDEGCRLDVALRAARAALEKKE